MTTSSATISCSNCKPAAAAAPSTCMVQHKTTTDITHNDMIAKLHIAAAVLEWQHHQQQQWCRSSFGSSNGKMVVIHRRGTSHIVFVFCCHCCTIARVSAFTTSTAVCAHLLMSELLSLGHLFCMDNHFTCIAFAFFIDFLFDLSFLKA